jgi:hypothetical protein
LSSFRFRAPFNIILPRSRALRAARIIGQVDAVPSDSGRLMRLRRRRGAPASSASIAANSLSMSRADGAPSLSLRWIRKLLADEVIVPREFGVVRERLLNAIGVAAAQRPRRMPRQQGLDLVSLFSFIANLVRFLSP